VGEEVGANEVGMRGRRETNVAAGGKRANSNGGNPCKTYDETNRRFFIVLNKYRERERSKPKTKLRARSYQPLLLP
jgi:hypothetical protein